MSVLTQIFRPHAPGSMVQEGQGLTWEDIAADRRTRGLEAPATKVFGAGADGSADALAAVLSVTGLPHPAAMGRAA